MATTRAIENKKLRQEALRAQLSAKGLIQQVIEISNKLGSPDTNLTPPQIQSLRASADLKMKLVNKYLPDLKAAEASEDKKPQHETDVNWTIKIME